MSVELKEGRGEVFHFRDSVFSDLALLLFSSLILRFLLASLDGYRTDLNTFTAWFYAATEGSILDFYRNIWCDYPPFNVVIFWVFGTIARGFSLFGTPFLLYVLKLPSNLFDIGISALIFFYLRKRMGRRWAFLATAAYAFNPATIFNASIWGQFDAIYTFFILLSLILILEDKPRASLVSFAFAVLSKPQAFAFLPVIVLLVIERFHWKERILSFLSFSAIILLFIVPFYPENPIDFVFRLYLGGYSQYRFVSLNAFNLWAFVGFTVQDTESILPLLTYQIAGWILFGILLCLILYCVGPESFSKRYNSLTIYLTYLVFFAFFLVLTRMHERYLFPVIALSLLSLTYTKKATLIFGVVTGTVLFNQAYTLQFLNNQMFVPSGDPAAYATSLLNLAVFSYSLYLLFNEEKLKRKSKGNEF